MIEQDNDELYTVERSSAPEASPSPANMSPEEYLEFRRDQRRNERPWYKDIARGVFEAPEQILGGARDAMQETINAVDDLNEWLVSKGVPDTRPEATKDGKLRDSLPEVEGADSTTGSMIRGVSQFLTGFAGANKVLGKIQPITKAGKVGKAMAAGAMADAVVFDPEDPRLSNLIQEYPSLQNPVSEYLESSPDDSKAEGRFKNALEGLGLGAVTEGMFLAMRGFKAARQAKNAPEVIEEATESARHGVVTGKEETALNETAKKIIEDEERIARTPLVQVKEEDSDSFAELVKEGDLDKAGSSLHFNLDRISDREGIHEVINLTSEVFQKEIEKGVKPARTHEHVKDLAREMGTSVDRLNETFSNVKNLDSHVLSVRQLMAASADRVFALAEQARTGDKEAMVKLRHAASLHASIQGEVKGIQTEVARAMSAMRIEAKSTKARNRELDHVLEAFGGDRVNQEFAERILQAKAAGGKDARAQLSNALRSGWWARTRDAVIAMRANGLLSNPSTHVINISGNLMTIMNNISERAIAARIGGAEGVQAGEAMAMINGMVGSFSEAMGLAWKAAKTGEPSDTFTKLDFKHNAISAEAFGASGNIGQAIDYLGVGIGIPGRMLVAGDEFFKTMAYRAEVHATAFRKVSQSGLEGQEAKNKLAELIADPPSDIKAGAVDFANYSTFTKDLTGASKLVSDLAARVPMVRLFIPFIRTPLNIVKYAGERTPFIRKHVDWIKNDLESGDPAKVQLTQAKLATGNMLYMTGMMLAANGVITGSPPADREMAKRWREYGWQPNSVRIGDTYYPYNRADPFGMFLGFASDMITMGDAWSDEEYEEMAQIAVASVHANLIDKNYLAGLSQMFEVIGSDENSLWKLEKAGKNIAVSTVPYSSLLRGLTRTNDNVIREANTVWEEMKRNTPWGSGELPPSRDIMGNPRLYPEGAFMNLVSPIKPSKIKNDLSLREIARLGIDIKGMKSTKRLGGHELTLAQTDKWAEEWGKLNSSVIPGLVESSQYQQMPDGQKKMVIEVMLRRNKEAAKGLLMGAFPDEISGLKIDDKFQELEDILQPEINPRRNFP